ncbi:MAG: hypothetical protein JNK82_38570 [Myxococcaceae bacterium]|nr:hypothetical protein [Myxococcaceae bacterium]
MITGVLPLRFEDVAMDGRVRLESLTASLGLVWRDELTKHPLYPWAMSEGIIPITTRFVLEAGDGPFAIDAPVEARGTWDIQRSVGVGGATRHFLLTLRTELHAPLGRTNLPPPDDAGTRARVGSVLAEHVFTRPFEEGAKRRVTELGEHGVSAPVVPWAEPQGALELPPDAKPLGPLERAGEPCRFGLTHTDSNQHVNSLVYPRLFEDVLLRRLGRGDLLARHLDVRFRKPSFAGDVLEVLLQPYEREGRLGAAGVFVEPGAEPKTGRVFLRMELQ